MKYIVFDMEWNQTYGREKPLSYGKSLTGEIIEIGAVRLSENFVPEDTFKVYVRPKFYTKMHSMVKKLTGIGTETLKSGLSFREALEDFRAFCTDSFVTLTWGDSDVPILRENIEAHALPRWTAKNYNLQTIYMKEIQSKSCVALEDAAQALGIGLDVRYHDALNDAAVTAEIARRIDTAAGIAVYKEPLGDFSSLEILAYEEIRNITNLQKLRGDSRIRITPCPVCGKDMCAERIIPQSAGKKLACVFCPDHGKFLLRIRTSKGKDASFNASKFVYEWNDDVDAFFSDKLATADRKKEKFLSRVRSVKAKK